MESVSLAGRLVGPEAPPYVVAEIGANHNGDLELCRRLVDAARDAGADAVKFQSWSKDSLISRGEYERNARHTNAYGNGSGPTLAESVERYQLGAAQHQEIAAYCQAQGITFFSSCFSAGEVDLLESLGVPAYKIASMDVNHLPLLTYVGRTGKPVILSTGMATLGEIERALDTLREAGSGPVILLHCVSVYPCPPSIVHLRNLGTLQRAFDVPVGYSDHTLGIAVPVAAVALGACLLEKHFTIDRALEGWDHAISADPAELRALVIGARDAFDALGSAVRTVDPAQRAKRAVFRRRLVVTRDLPRGARIGLEDVDFKRPGTGIRPDELPYVVGRPLARDVAAEEEIAWSDLA